MVVAVRDDGSQIAFCPLRPGKAEERPGRPPADHSAARSEWQVGKWQGAKRNPSTRESERTASGMSLNVHSREKQWTGEPLPPPQPHSIPKTNHQLRSYQIWDGAFRAQLGCSPCWSNSPSKTQYALLYKLSFEKNLTNRKVIRGFFQYNTKNCWKERSIVPEFKPCYAM